MAGSTESKNEATFLRYATPNERRCISRESLGYYNVVVVGAVYTLASSSGDHEIDISALLVAALRACVAQHPCLASLVRAADTEQPYFERALSLDLRRHVDVMCADGEARAAEGSGSGGGESDAEFMQRVLPAVLDGRLRAGQPAWRVVVHGMSAAGAGSGEQRRYFVAFAYSHSFADGVSGLALHSSLLAALRNNQNAGAVELSSEFTTSSDQQIAAPFDTKTRLPISWSFLLTPLLAVYLPGWLSRFFDMRAAASEVNDGTWTGAPMSYDKDHFKTGVLVLELEADTVKALLQQVKVNRAKLTAVLHGLVLRALDAAVRQYSPEQYSNFVSTTAVNMRRSISVADSQMGLFVSGCYEMREPASHDFGTKDVSPFWASARDMTKSIAECAATLEDQPIGLLRYVPSIRNWTASKLGKKRDSSYEISNLGVFDTFTNNGASGGNTKIVWNITKAVFCQPACATSAPIVFNFVSTKNGSLVCAIDWQLSALGVAPPNEVKFAELVRHSIQKDVASITA